jgi:hypothetical protein
MSTSGNLQQAHINKARRSSVVPALYRQLRSFAVVGSYDGAATWSCCW